MVERMINVVTEKTRIKKATIQISIKTEALRIGAHLRACSLIQLRFSSASSS
jgi:hypothetical protein